MARSARRLGVGGMTAWALLGLLLSPPALAAQPESNQKELTPIEQHDPAADLLREIGEQDALVGDGRTQARGVDSAILLNPLGEPWRQFRMNLLIPIGGYALLAVIVLLLLFYLVRGRVKVAGGLSDKKLLRYTAVERAVHWFMAVIFVVLALSGLVLLFGRAALMPWVGNEDFAPVASFSKIAHDYAGPWFTLALILLFLKFVRRNFYARGDLAWVLAGGGIVGRGHPRSGFFNAGEKTVFWLAMIGGVAISVSGFVLLFPNAGLSRPVMALSHVVHGITVLVLIAVILGHVYIGTLGMQGSFDGMRSGYSDLNWAKQHHSDWAEAEQPRALSSVEVERLRGG